MPISSILLLLALVVAAGPPAFAGCPFLTRPSVETEDDVTRMNTHAEGGWLCLGEQRVQCLGGIWRVDGLCNFASDSVARNQACVREGSDCANQPPSLEAWLASPSAYQVPRPISPSAPPAKAPVPPDPAPVPTTVFAPAPGAGAPAPGAGAAPAAAGGYAPVTGACGIIGTCNQKP